MVDYVPDRPTTDYVAVYVVSCRGVESEECVVVVRRWSPPGCEEWTSRLE